MGGRGVGIMCIGLECLLEEWRDECSVLPLAQTPTAWPLAKLAVCTLVTKSGRNLQLRLRDGDLPLEGGLRLPFCMRLHVRLTRVAIVQGVI